MLPAASFELVTPEKEQNVDLVVGTGQLIRVEQEFSSLFVANPDVADIEVKSPRLLYLTGVGVGETTLFAVDDADNVLMSSKIRVTHNLGALRDGIARVAPGQRVNVTTVDQSLVITGAVGTADEATNILQVASQFVDDPSRVVNRMTVDAPTQVNLQVRIAEVARNVDRQLGIRWNAVSGTLGGSRIGFVGGSGITGSGGYSVAGGVTRGSFSIDVVLQALAEEGLVTIMAEPNLTARSGEPARFLAGGEYPYAVSNDDQNTIQFKDFGIGLSFTPTVMDGRTRLSGSRPLPAALSGGQPERCRPDRLPLRVRRAVQHRDPQRLRPQQQRRRRWSRRRVRVRVLPGAVRHGGALAVPDRGR
jgi:pilus assembly protein CpaC